ncbi:MAG: sugar ABC transporter permease [Saccharofermentans sp.]|nr:sugar ABC transporter permease [Saccharofermentans sp.]
MRNKKLVDYAKYGYLFSLPFILTFCIFTLYPVIYTFVIGFTDLKGAGNTEIHVLPFISPKDGSPFYIFNNFKDVLTSKTFHKAFSNTWIIWFLNFFPQMGFALLFTAWFTDRRSKVKGTGLFKVLFYMPNIITAATMAILFQKLFGFPVGAVNQLFNAAKPYNFLINNWPVKFIIAFVQFFQWYGHTMVNLIAGVIGISPEIFEAAEIDGANRVQTFFKVTIPCIRQIMLFVLVTSLIGGLNMFDIPQLLVGPKNANGAALTTNMYIRNQAFDGSYLYNRAAAASVILFIIIVVLSAIVFFLLRDKDEAKLKKLKKAELKAARKGM